MIKNNKWTVILAAFLGLTPVFAADEGTNLYGEPLPVAKAFSEIYQTLASVQCLELAFTSTVHSLHGDVEQSGTVLQEPPYRFRSDVKTHAMDGITRAHEIIMSNGTNGWELSFSPNGRLITCSYWTLASMGNIFASFLQKSAPYLLTVAKTNSYEALRYNYLFKEVKRTKDGWEFGGNIRRDSELLRDVAKQATAMGPTGFSNFVPNRVTMKIANEGLVTEFKRFNLFDKPLSEMRLLAFRVNAPQRQEVFFFTPPKGIFLANLDILQELPAMYVKHSLLHKKAPDIKVQYLSGKDKIIKPGAKGLTILTFFASWSQLCREYMVVIDKLHSKYAGSGVQFVNVSDQQDMKTLQAFQRGLNTVIYADSKRELVKTYDIDQIPKTFIIDSNGIVRYVMEGFNTASELELGKRIDELKEEAKTKE